MRSSTLLPLLFALIVTVFSETEARWECVPCKSEEECNKSPPQICPWGITRNNCNRRVCAKGPGERCGGRNDFMGICGEGMMCTEKDDKCHGCSTETLECFT